MRRQRDREIAERLNRSEASIRNLRYKKRLVASARNETGELFKQRDELNEEVKALQNRKATLTNEVTDLTKTMQTLEASIKTDKFILELTLAKALMSLELVRPDLFYMSGQDQIVQLVKVLMPIVLKALGLSR